MRPTPAEFARHLDSTNLRPDARAADLRHLCEEAARLGCAAVMLYPTEVGLAASLLQGTGVRVGTVVGFPSGRFTIAGKSTQISVAAANGADEVDIVMHYAALRDGDPRYAADEVDALCAQARDLGLTTKVIVETCYLSEGEKLTALRLCEDAGADFIKTSTGFGTAGATVADIALWAHHRRGDIRLKAAGGIKTLAFALDLIAAGAVRLGTSNAAALVAELAGGAAPAGPSAAPAGPAAAPAGY